MEDREGLVMKVQKSDERGYNRHKREVAGASEKSDFYGRQHGFWGLKTLLG
jgi:hypothetical protein